MQNRKKLRVTKKKCDCVNKTSQSQAAGAKKPSSSHGKKGRKVGALVRTFFGCCFTGSQHAKDKTGVAKDGVQVVIHEQQNNPIRYPGIQSSQCQNLFVGYQRQEVLSSRGTSPITNHGDQEAGPSRALEHSLGALPNHDTACSLSLAGSIDTILWESDEQQSGEKSERESVSGSFLKEMQSAPIHVWLGHTEPATDEALGRAESGEKSTECEDDATFSSLPGPFHKVPALSSGKSKLPPLDPTYLARAMKNMKKALEKVEREESIPSIVPTKVLRKLTNDDQKRRNRFDKLTARFMRHAAIGDRLAMKAKLSKMKRAIKEEEEALSSIKEKAKISEIVDKAGKNFDDEQARVTQKETIATDNAIEKHGEAIEALKREITLLQDKQASKLLQCDLLRNKGFEGILSQAVWQCKAVKLRHRHCRLSEEINELWDRVYSHQNQIKELVSFSSNGHISGSEEEIHMVLENSPHSAESETDSPCNREIYRLDVEQKACSPHASKVRGLFIGESFKKPEPRVHICKWTEEPSCSYTPEERNTEERKDTHKTSSDDEFYFTDFEEELYIDLEPSPAFYRSTRDALPREALPGRLYSVEEETAEDWQSDCDKDMHVREPLFQIPGLVSSAV